MSIGATGNYASLQEMMSAKALLPEKPLKSAVLPPERTLYDTITAATGGEPGSVMENSETAAERRGSKARRLSTGDSQQATSAGAALGLERTHGRAMEAKRS